MCGGEEEEGELQCAVEEEEEEGERYSPDCNFYDPDSSAIS